MSQINKRRKTNSEMRRTGKEEQIEDKKNVD